MINVGVALALAGVAAAIALGLLYFSLLKQVRTFLTWGLFTFSLAALAAGGIELAMFTRMGNAMSPALQGSLVLQAALFTVALGMLAWAAWMPQLRLGPLRERADDRNRP